MAKLQSASLKRSGSLAASSPQVRARTSTPAPIRGGAPVSKKKVRRSNGRKLDQASTRGGAGSPRAEAKLVGGLIRTLPQLLVRYGAAWSLSMEVPAGRSIADIVCVVRRGDAKTAAVPPLSALESVLAAALRRDGPLTENALRRLCGFHEGELPRGALRRLESRGLLMRDERSGLLSAARPWATVTMLIAIEAKLHRWRDALQQASEYRKYADLAFVALPAHTAKRALAQASQFRATGVGLLTVVDGLLRVTIAPARSRNHDWRREFVLSRTARTQRGKAGSG